MVLIKKRYDVRFEIIIFSVLSVFCSIITVLIYLKMKQLRTVIYHFFFHIAINEMLSRLTYLIRVISQFKVIFIFRSTTFLTYFFDTNIITLVAFACFGMYQLILKQNTKLASQFHKISIFLYAFSLIITIIFYVLSINDDDPAIVLKDTDLYRNIITLFFTTDKNNGNIKPILFSCIVYLILSFYALVNIILIQIFVKDRANISSNVGNDEATDDDKKIKSSLKLRTFRLRLLAYPLLNFGYVIPLFVYAWIDYTYLTNIKDYEENIYYLRIRYAFFNIYCFMNSIRGFLFFLAFIVNEKIKIFLFKNYLNFEIFKTIDKIKKEELKGRKSSFTIESSPRDSLEREMVFNMDSSFDLTTDKKEEKKEKKKEKKNKDNESEKGYNLIDLDIEQRKSPKKYGLINDEDNSDEDEEECIIGRDVKSDTTNMKKIEF